METTLPYPFYSTFKRHSQLREAFDAVCKYELKFANVPYTVLNLRDLEIPLKFNGKPTIIDVGTNDYEVNWISNWFSEKVRIKARRYDEELSPLEYWNLHAKEISDSTHPSPYNQTNSIKLQNDKLYEHVSGCNTFRATLTAGFIKWCGAQSVLDFSAGWGDRLIGAIAAGVSYTGVDPNIELHPCYEAIIREFARDASKYRMIASPFETLDIDTLSTYDLVFTSPPYFDLEIYSPDDTQSIIAHPTLSEWFSDFLIVSLKKAYSRLNPGGYLVCIINNIRGKPDFVGAMIERVAEFDDIEYLGVISYAKPATNHKSPSKQQQKFHQQRHNNKPNTRQYASPQPMWIWRKKLVTYDFGIKSQLTIREFENIKQLKPDLIVKADANQLMLPNTLYLGTIRVSDSASHIINICGEKVGGIIDDILRFDGGNDSGETFYKIYYPTIVELNPKLVIVPYKNADVIFNVVRDDLLPGGTKQRAMDILRDFPETEFVYAGPWNGFAQVALAIGCQLVAKRATVFMTRDDYETNIRAITYGCKIVTVQHAKLWKLQEHAVAYANRNNACLVEFGMPEVKSRLAAAIIEANDASSSPIPRDTTANIWIAGGSGTIAQVLLDVFENATVCVVQVGKKITFEHPRMRLYISTIHFYEDVIHRPPYPSATKYDAKVWEFVVLNGNSGDYIWNVAGVGQ